MDQTALNRPETLSDKEIIEALLEGASLRTYMVPDEALSSNRPVHVETYHLPHVLINGNSFWGKSETAHLAHYAGSQRVEEVAFAYTNIGPIFCSYGPSSRGARLMSKKRYKEHLWLLRNSARLVWDSAGENDVQKVRSEIEAGSKFKIAMLDSEAIWNIHPVDLPMYYLEQGYFELKTVADQYPIFFRYPAQTEEILHQYSSFFRHRPGETDPGAIQISEVKEFHSFYALRSDGTYYNFFDIPRKTVQKYERLKVFVDR